MEIAIRVLPNGEGLPLPAYETAGAAGCDLRSAEDAEIPPGEWRVIPCGIILALPNGYEAQVRPRSGLAARHGVTVLNAPGTIDSDYRGEIRVPLINHGPTPFQILRGDRIAQMVIAPVSRASWRIVDAHESTVRGASGFGSTGKT